MAGTPHGFAYREADGVVHVSHHGRPGVVLRGAAAARFLAEIDDGDPQAVMARVTGNYKRGNERTARDHPRNRGR